MADGVGVIRPRPTAPRAGPGTSGRVFFSPAHRAAPFPPSVFLTAPLPQLGETQGGETTTSSARRSLAQAQGPNTAADHPAQTFSPTQEPLEAPRDKGLSWESSHPGKGPADAASLRRREGASSLGVREAQGAAPERKSLERMGLNPPKASPGRGAGCWAP